MPHQINLGEILQVGVVNSTAFAITFTELEIGLKVLLLLVSIIYTFDKWIAHRQNMKNKKNGQSN